MIFSNDLKMIFITGWGEIGRLRAHEDFQNTTFRFVVLTKFISQNLLILFFEKVNCPTKSSHYG